MRTQKYLEVLFLLKKEKKVKEEKRFSSLLGRTEEGTDPSFLFSQQKRRYQPNLSLFVKACLLRFYQLPLFVEEINEFSSPSRERGDLFVSQRRKQTSSRRSQEGLFLLVGKKSFFFFFQQKKRTTSVERKNDAFSSEKRGMTFSSSRSRKDDGLLILVKEGMIVFFSLNYLLLRVEDKTMVG